MSIVTDFDGTVIRCNSFPYWVMFALVSSVISFRWRLAFQLLRLIFFRKILRTISHLQFKERLDDFDYPDRWPIAFCQNLKRHSNFSVCSLIDDLMNGNEGSNALIISTAAPSCYASRLAEIFFPLHNVHVISSTRINGIFVDNSGEKKVDMLRRDNLGKVKVFFTDSSDDLPMAKISEKVYLCNPSSSTINVFAESGIKYTVLRG